MQPKGCRHSTFLTPDLTNSPTSPESSHFSFLSFGLPARSLGWSRVAPSTRLRGIGSEGTCQLWDVPLVQVGKRPALWNRVRRNVSVVGRARSEPGHSGHSWNRVRRNVLVVGRADHGPRARANRVESDQKERVSCGPVYLGRRSPGPNVEVAEVTCSLWDEQGLVEQKERVSWGRCGRPQRAPDAPTWSVVGTNLGSSLEEQSVKIRAEGTC